MGLRVLLLLSIVVLASPAFAQAPPSADAQLAAVRLMYGEALQSEQNAWTAAATLKAENDKLKAEVEKLKADAAKASAPKPAKP